MSYAYDSYFMFKVYIPLLVDKKKSFDYLFPNLWIYFFSRFLSQKKIEYAPDWAPLLPEPGGDDDGVVGQVDVHPVDGWSTWHP